MNKNEGYILAIDAGTGSGRAVLFDIEGHQVAVGQKEWTHKSDSRYPNSMEFDVGNNWQLLCRCIRRALQEGGIAPAEVLGISATSMREGSSCMIPTERSCGAVPTWMLAQLMKFEI